jgi:taurine dehydrogenase small subunit
MNDFASNFSDVQGNVNFRLSIIKRLALAWENKDIETLLSLITDDCVYTASVGPEPGERFVGKEAVCRGFMVMLANDPIERAQVSNIFVSGDRAACEWRYFKTDDNGDEMVTHGCDLFSFNDGKISVKESFRKTYPRIMAGDIYDGEDYRGAF